MEVSLIENPVRFDLFELDLAGKQLRKNGSRIRLPQQPLQLLSLLVQRPGEIVTREELRQRLWPSDVFVDFDHGLNKSIQKLRYALGDSAGSPRYIETIPRVGYRFIAPLNGGIRAPELNTEIPQPEALPAGPTAATIVGGQRARWFVLAGCVALVAVTVWWFSQRRPRATEPIQTLAVLPLENLSGDPSQEYFADGMTDELITMLARESTLRITSRTSVMQYKNAHRPLAEIARKLHVDGILEGSVSRSRDRVHLNLQLIRADTDTHLWAESYDRDINNIGLPGDAAQDVAKRLQSAAPRPPAIRYVNPAAHDAYLRGRYLWFTDRMKESGQYFRKAIEIQPDYALGWAGLSDYYGENVAFGSLDPRTNLPLEEQAAEHALQLDPNLAEAHQAMGAAFFFARWDWANADREILNAIRLAPNNAELYFLRASVLQALNRNQEAIDAEKKAMELDPFERPYGLASVYQTARQYDAALAEAHLRMEASPNNAVLLFAVADTWRSKGNYKEAVDGWVKLLTLTGDPQLAVSLRHAFDQGGVRGFARWQINQRLIESKNSYVSPVRLACYHAQNGDKEETLALLEEGYRQRSPDVLFIQTDPAYDFLHNDPRYRSLVQRIGLPPAY